ncbi:MAG: DegT/DnrJ/EryC1/StrS family aminotransferase [Patescibacteria group bacterium]
MIPLFDLTKELSGHRKEFDGAIKRVMRSGVFILGKEGEALEHEIALYTKANHAIGVSSGTRALQLGLQALGVKAGDKVIMPALALPTAFGVADTGAQLILVDAEPDSLQMDPAAVEAALKKRDIKAIVVVHLYGHAAPIKKIVALANRHRVPVIEDCAQGFGVTVSGKHVGTFGKLGTLSFYPTKNLGALGDGGMVITSSKAIAEDVRKRRMYGERERYLSEFAGTNSRLDELQAALLRVKLDYFSKSKKQRRDLDYLYRLHLANLPVTIPTATTDSEPVPHLFVIQTTKRDELQAFLAKRGIGTGIHYSRPIHLQPAFKHLGYKQGDFPVAERASETLLSLPFYPTLTTSQVEKVCHGIKQFFETR